MDVVTVVRYVFGAVGTVLLVGALVAVQNSRSFLSDAVSARGTVQDLVPRTSTGSDGRSSTTFAPAVRFTTAQGEQVTFVSSTSSNPPAQQVGDTVDVLYLPQDPQNARLADWFSLWGLATILGGLGAVFATVSAGLTIAARHGRSRSRGRRGTPQRLTPRAAPSDPGLRHTGVRVQADVQLVQPTGTFAGDGSPCYRIVAQWLDPDRHQMRVYTSDDLPFDPTPYLTGRTVDVYIAPDDPARYYLDVSFLPRPAP